MRTTNTVIKLSALPAPEAGGVIRSCTGGGGVIRSCTGGGGGEGGGGGGSGGMIAAATAATKTELARPEEAGAVLAVVFNPPLTKLVPLNLPGMVPATFVAQGRGVRTPGVPAATVYACSHIAWYVVPFMVSMVYTCPTYSVLVTRRYGISHAPDFERGL
jgi:hypothetical protein